MAAEAPAVPPPEAAPRAAWTWRWPGLAAVLVLAFLVRLPFWIEASKLAVDGDTAIVGLMARDGLTASAFWGQPYGSPLDAWLAAPWVALLGPTILAVRLPYFVLSLALVALTWGVARHLHPAAAAPAAFVMAVPPAYFVLLAALPPPLYPTTLVLLGALLLGALRLVDRLRAGRSAAAALCCWGAGAGLALWTHLVAVAVVAPCAWWLLRAARTPRRAWLGVALCLAAGALAGGAPALYHAWSDPFAFTVSSLDEAPATVARHFLELLPRLHLPVLGLLGAHVPPTADDPERKLALPGLGQAVLAALYGLGLWRALQARRRAAERVRLAHEVAAWAARPAPAGAAAVLAADRTVSRAERAASSAGLLGAAALLTLLVFPWPLRAGPETLRFLTPAYLPLVVLVVWAPVAEGHRRGAWLVALILGVLHLGPTTGLLAEWRTAPTALIPDCRPALALLEQRGLTHAWASYNTAWCLSYLGAGRVRAAQPWNERFPGYPLPWVDEVRRAADAAWVLVPGADFALPDRKQFEQRLHALGARFRATPAGEAWVYDNFHAPFGDAVLPAGLGAGAAGDGRLETRALEPGRGATTWTLAPARALDAVTLFGGLGPPGLPDGLVMEVSSDGVVFERQIRLRPQARDELVWVDGRPQVRAGFAAFTLPLGGRTVAALRLRPQPEQGPWSAAEVLLHPTGAAPPSQADQQASAGCGGGQAPLPLSARAYWRRWWACRQS